MLILRCKSQTGFLIGDNILVKVDRVTPNSVELRIATQPKIKVKRLNVIETQTQQLRFSPENPNAPDEICGGGSD